MKRIIGLLMILLLSSQTGIADEAPEIDRILSRLNHMNRFSDVYTATVKIATFSPKKDKALSAYKIYVKGLNQVLLNQLYPKKDINKKILMRDGKMWFYFPRVKKAILINARNTLFGTVSVGDVLSPPITNLYKLKDVTETEVNDREAIRLEFEALSHKSPFGKMVYFYQENQIIASESYTRSGILLKKAFFEDYIETEDGIPYASKIKIVNQVNPAYYSMIMMSDLTRLDSLPAKYFMVEGLDEIEG